MVSLICKTAKIPVGTPKIASKNARLPLAGTEKKGIAHSRQLGFSLKKF